MGCSRLENMVRGWGGMPDEEGPPCLDRDREGMGQSVNLHHQPGAYNWFLGPGGSAGGGARHGCGWEGPLGVGQRGEHDAVLQLEQQALRGLPRRGACDKHPAATRHLQLAHALCVRVLAAHTAGQVQVQIIYWKYTKNIVSLQDWLLIELISKCLFAYHNWGEITIRLFK